MADPRCEILLRDDDAGAFDMVVNKSRTRTGEIVDVVEAVSEIGSDLHPRRPCRETGEARIVPVAEAIGEAGSGGELVDEVDVAAGD